VQSRVVDHFPCPAAQNVVGFVGCEGTLLVHVQLAIHLLIIEYIFQKIGTVLQSDKTREKNAQSLCQPSVR